MHQEATRPFENQPRMPHDARGGPRRAARIAEGNGRPARKSPKTGEFDAPMENVADSMSRWLERLRKKVMPDLSGATLELASFFECSAPKDARLFVRSLGTLLPADSALYLEGGTPSREIEDTLNRNEAPAKLKIARATIWPKPRIHHVQACHAALMEIAALFVDHASPEVCDHFHVYHEQVILLQWHDAFGREPFLLAGSFRNSVVHEFCSAVGSTYKRVSQQRDEKVLS